LVGYARAAEIAREALRRDKTIGDIAVEKGILDKKKAAKLLDPKRLTGS
jgi:fumarate hydratase class II